MHEGDRASYQLTKEFANFCARGQCRIHPTDMLASMEDENGAVPYLAGTTVPHVTGAALGLARTSAAAKRPGALPHARCRVPADTCRHLPAHAALLA